MASRKQLAAMAFAVLFLLALVQPPSVTATAPGRPRLPGDSAWDNRFGGPPGVDGVVEALAINGKTGEVYVGGRFRWAGSTPASSVAKWDPSTKQWSALGAGVLGGYSDVRAIAVTSSGTVYAGGSFGKWDGNVADFLIRWNGKTWSGVGAGVNADVEALTASGSAVYAGGNFSTAGGLKVNGIARWSESTKGWSALGSGVTGTVNAIAVVGSQVFVGGAFKQAGGAVVNNLAAWNGSKWSSVGGGVADALSRGQVNAIAVSGKNLYVGGYFIQAGVTLANGLARWDGTSWSALSNQFGIASRGVHALAFSGSILYIGGDIEYGINPDDAEFIAENIVALDTGTGHWSPLGDIASGIPLAFAVAGSTIYVGGDFMFAGGQNFGAIAAWDGAMKSWSALGTNVNNSVDGEVYALAIDGGDVYLGGTFGHAAMGAVNNLARRNASTNTWSDVGGGVSCSVCSPIVTALIVNGGKLYAAGNFDTAGGVSVNNIAAWDEAAKTWSAVGSPPFYYARAMAFDASNNLYVGTTGALYKWDGANWTDLGGGGLVHGGPSTIHSVAVDGSDVYVGGDFQSVTDRVTEIPANHVAKWSSTNGWSGLGSGVSWPDGSGDVNALAVNGGNLYVGGGFSTAGGNPANAIAKWDGANWSTFDNGMPGGVISAISYLNGVLFAGGAFLQAGISLAMNIAAWDGTRWVPLGGGVDFNRENKYPRVDALAVNGTDSYVGGAFTTAGNKWSNDFARFDASAALAPPPIVTYEDSDVAVQYDTWRVLRDVDNWVDFSRISSHKGDTAQFTFTGKSVTWLTSKGPDKGQAQITIDGANKGAFDLYSVSASAFERAFSGLSNAAHKITMKVLGTKNASASDANVAVNGFLAGQSVTGSGDRRIQYNKWSGAVNSKASGGTYRSNPEKGSTATFTFVGTGVSWVTMKGPAYGQAEVFLDDADRGKVDLYAPTAQAQRPVSYTGLSEGTHKLQIRVLGTKNAAATSARVIVDAFQVTP